MRDSDSQFRPILCEVTVGCDPQERYFALIESPGERGETIAELALGRVALEMGTYAEHLEGLCHAVRISDTPAALFQRRYPYESVMQVDEFEISAEE